MSNYFEAFQLMTGNIFVQILLVIWVALGLQLASRWVIGRLVAQAVRSHHYQSRSDEKKREKTLVTIFRTAITTLIWVTAVIVILGLFNIQLSTLLTGAGVVGVVVGFGAQNLIRDFLAGFFVVLENQYRVGDTITVRNFGMELTGVVEDITVRITRLRDEDGNLHTVPNGVTWSVTNRTFDYANINLSINVDYEADVDKVEKIINAIGEDMQAHEAWGQHIIEPIRFLRVDSFGDKTVTVKTLGKVVPARQWEVAGEFRRRLLVKFKKAGITMTHIETDNK